VPNTPALKQTVRLITLPVCALLSVLASTVHGQDARQINASERPADYSIKVTAYFDSATLADFGDRIKGYLELRTRLDSGVPRLRVTIDPDEISKAEDVLGDRIRVARAAAKQGDIFARPFQDQVGRMLVVEVDEKTLAVIMGDNPGEFSFKVNGTYPKHKSVSTVPANLLQLLPALEDDVEYRFVGRRLILRDTKANIIIDEIPFALTCHDCGKGSIWSRLKKWTVGPRPHAD
jgi:hypothetical protein